MAKFKAHDCGIMFHHHAHVQLWVWLAENPTKMKIEWPRWEKNGGPWTYRNNWCFCCGRGNYATPCASFYTCGCPLVWPASNGIGCTDCDRQGALFYKWRAALGNDPVRRELAYQISNLPINPLWAKVE